MTVSIIIAVKTWQKNLEECVDNCLKLDYPDFEIIILPDEDRDCPRFSGTVSVFVVPTGPLGPAQKRDVALSRAKGEILAFLDDDAYPVQDWLKNAVKNFEDDNIAAVGGPALTPLNDNLRQKASGAIYSSILISGNFSYRYVRRKRREIEDYPSCNLLVRKSVMQKLGGFNTDFWPGEDTKLCLDIVHSLGRKIMYDPEAVVYHHRRPVFKPHLKQIAAYALHRGYFVKKYPQTSLKLAYFIPSLFLCAVLSGALLSVCLPAVKTVYFFSLSLYLCIVFIFSVHKELSLIPYVFFGIIFTHFTYGFYFIKGLVSNKLKEDQ